ncbi:DUF1653 domain-containing protein [Bacillus velezensis]|uniref:DUF1653 domain-containing protein n=2 Tax=Bacillus subtilis group TaxID=653685 RepID=UPI002E289AE9|nr:DUF1653 domain-containing protein [Bacillus velezensis]
MNLKMQEAVLHLNKYDSSSKSAQDAQKLLNALMDTYEVVGCWFRHYKGGLYKVIGEVIHTETEEKLVTYEDQYAVLWARPKEMFFGKVIVDGKEIKRFTKID